MLEKITRRLIPASPFGLLVLIFAMVPVITNSPYKLNVASHILVWGLFAVSFNMLWGITGMLSFGQALYYGLGAYSVGLMVEYLGSTWFLPALAAGLLMAFVLSFLLGLLVIRVGGVYFTMLTLAFAQLAWQITFKWYDFTGGDDGIQGIIPPGILQNRIVYYYFVLLLVFLSIWTLKRMAYSPFGMILRCIQQNPERIRFLGRRVRRNQLRIYMISSFFAALAGGMMAGVDSSIHTDMLLWTTSGEAILMSVLGGISQFFGPFFGAAVFILLEDNIGAVTEYWPLIIGSVMLFMVIIFPKGIVGEALGLKVRFGKTGTGRSS
ncbi:branched-chain amino acid ABC transporter permease [Desulfatiglans anilini]|uniref:branched-chain amino acid ABC transporter permease n=1 Tax=Desulfatiglans anilini TaxID=90728 RepID=UPI000412AB4C|nr:branched-chain amino acid ABC transporter permease [Desulfatiglans anilini]